jgi:hypothetical protein
LTGNPLPLLLTKLSAELVSVHDWLHAVIVLLNSYRSRLVLATETRCDLMQLDWYGVNRSVLVIPPIAILAAMGLHSLPLDA